MVEFGILYHKHIHEFHFIWVVLKISVMVEFGILCHYIPWILYHSL